MRAFEQLNFSLQQTPAFFEIRFGIQTLESHLIDNGQNRDLKQNRMKPGALDHDIQFTIVQGLDGDVFFIQAKQAQEIHKITFDESQTSQPLDLIFVKT